MDIGLTWSVAVSKLDWWYPNEISFPDIYGICLKTGHNCPPHSVHDDFEHTKQGNSVFSIVDGHSEAAPL